MMHYRESQLSYSQTYNGSTRPDRVLQTAADEIAVTIDFVS
jgi:hypothetical protein